jgi:hypothetical protein
VKQVRKKVKNGEKIVEYNERDSNDKKRKEKDKCLSFSISEK